MLRRCTALTPVSSSFEWNHFVDRSALFTNSFRQHRDIMSAKQIRSADFLNLPETYFKCELFLLTVAFTDGGGTTAPLSGGIVGFVALRCYAEECAISLSTQAQDHVWDLVEYKRVEPAHCPTGAMSGGTGGERKR